MCIILKDDIPVCQRARRLSCSEKLQVNDQIDDWLQQGIIRESGSDYCSPMEGKHSRTLERKISMRSTKEELIKKGVLMPDGTDKDQDSKIYDSVHQNHIPQINGFGP
ncbi:phosphatase and actin regulator 2 [Trichonephila clavipes]|nr:phosphatase and actin regulator 2 [Trichonephila clavipes]